jgi:hypothetical protein
VRSVGSATSGQASSQHRTSTGEKVATLSPAPGTGTAPTRTNQVSVAIMRIRAILARNESAPRRVGISNCDGYAAVPAMIEALWPPKPKLFDITVRSLRSRGVFGV